MKTETPTTQPETYLTALTFVKAMHARLKWQVILDRNGRRIENVGDLVNCLNNGQLEPAALGRRPRTRKPQ